MDKSLVSEHSLGSDVSGLSWVVDFLLQLLSGFWESQKTKSGKEGGSLLFASVLDMGSPELVNEEVEDFLLGEVGVAVMSVEFDWVLGLGDSSVDTGLVGDGSKGEDGGVLGLLRVFSMVLHLLDKALEQLDEGLGGSSGVLWKRQNILESLSGRNFMSLSQTVADSEGWSGSGDQQSVEVQGEESLFVGGHTVI
jgi:hypothetical protein